MNFDNWPPILFSIASILTKAGSLPAQNDVPEISYDSAPNLLKLPEHIHRRSGRDGDELEGKHSGEAPGSVARIVSGIPAAQRIRSLVATTVVD